MKEKLELRSEDMAAKNFWQCIRKKEKELVADLILLTRMILKFKILDEQLQDGLHPELMQNPSVSVAVRYKELYMAARNEENR